MTPTPTPATSSIPIEPHVGGVLLITAVVCLLFALFIYAVGTYRLKKSLRTDKLSTVHWNWPAFSHQKHRDYIKYAVVIFGAAIFGAAVIIEYIFVTVVAHENPNGILYSAGLPLALVATGATAWTLLVTMSIHDAQQGHFASMRQLLEDVTRYLQSRPNITFFYCVDFTAAVGGISATAQQVEFNTELQYALDRVVVGKKSLDVQFVCYDSDGIEEFHSSVSPLRIVDLNNDSELVIDKIRKGKGAVWACDNIGPLHLMVTDERAYIYMVIPQVDGQRNETAGMRSEDAFIIEFLRRTFIEWRRRATKPDSVVLKGEYVKISIKTAQQNISHVEIFASNILDDIPTNMRLVHEESLDPPRQWSSIDVDLSKFVARSIEVAPGKDVFVSLKLQHHRGSVIEEASHPTKLTRDNAPELNRVEHDGDPEAVEAGLSVDDRSDAGHPEILNSVNRQAQANPSASPRPLKQSGQRARPSSHQRRRRR